MTECELERQLLMRFVEIEGALEAIAAGRVAYVDCASVKAALLQEQAEIMSAHGGYFERRKDVDL